MASPPFAVLEPALDRRKTVVMNPRDTSVGPQSTTLQIADHLKATGKTSEALRLYHHILKKPGHDEEVLDSYVRCARALNHDPAQGLSTILRSRPDATAIRGQLVSMAWREGDHRRVRDLVDSAPGVPEVQWLLSAAAAALNMSDDQDAGRLYEQIRKREPGNEAAAAGLARLNARKRDFSGVLAALEETPGTQAAVTLNSIGLKVSANRRLGRTGQAASVAASGLDQLMDAGNLHDAARFLDRLAFPAAANLVRDAIRNMDDPAGRGARRRLAGHLTADGQISAGIREYRKLGGRNWQSRINPAHRKLYQVASRAFGSGAGDPDLMALEQMLVSIPGDAFSGLQRIANRTRCDVSDPGRVLQVTGTLGAGGAERQVVLTATGLVGRGAAEGWPQLATLQDLGQAGNAHQLQGLLDAGIIHHDLGADADGRKKLPLRLAHCDDLVSLLPDGFRQQLVALCNLLVRTRPGVVHGWQDVTGAVAALAGLLCGVERIVIGTRSIAPDRKEGRNRPWLRALMYGLLQNDRVRLLNNSRSGAADYSRWLGLPVDQIACVPNGFDLPANLPPLAEPDGNSFTVGGVMRLTEEKRPDLWLDTIMELIRRGRPVQGLLVGDGPMMVTLTERIADEGLEDRIELAGRRGDMPEQYARMNTLLLTSRTEGLPNVLVEAQAHGVPVVSTDAGGASETFVDGETGMLCREATAAALAEHLEVLMEDPARCTKMGEAGAAHARQEFGMARMLDRTAAVYGWRERDA